MTYEALYARTIAAAYTAAEKAARENIAGVPGNPHIHQPTLGAEWARLIGFSVEQIRDLSEAGAKAFQETYNAEIERAILDLRTQADRLAKTMFTASSESAAA